MNDLLVILDPRRISECLAAFDDLEIDKLWIRNMTEAQIAEAWPEVMMQAQGYDRLIAVSDDGIVRPHALDAVQALLDEGHPVVTGYSNLSATDFRVNLSKTPLGPEPAEDAYDLFTLAEVMESETPAIRTFFAGMCLTGMSVDMWLRYPFQITRNGAQSDFALAKRLERDRVPIVAARDGFVWHVKEVWNRGDQDPRKRLLIGVEPAEVVLERRSLGLSEEELAEIGRRWAAPIR